MVKVNILSASIGAALLLGAMGSAQAATKNQDVASLKAQVAELQQMVQQLSSQQQQQAVQLQQQAQTPPPAPVAAPVNASTKPGWITLPDGQTQLKVYGSVRVDSTYDFKANPTSSINNNTNAVPLNSANGTKNNLNVTAATSRIGLDIVRPTEYGDLIGKIEADFMGGGTSGVNGDGTFRVRHAYISLNKWLVGQTTSPFVNTDTAPETVDFNGPMGYGSKRTVQVRYTQPTFANQKLLVALEGGDVDNLNSNTTFVNGSYVKTSGGNRLPALTARYDIATPDKKGLLQLHGLLHENRISVNDNIDETKLGWGVGVGGKYNLTSNDTIFANYYHIKGDSKYLLYANPAYVAFRNGADLSIFESEYDTGLIGYSHKWSPQWRSTLAAGAIWYKKDNAYAKYAENKSDTALNKTMYNIIANSFYTPVKNLDLGVEYTYGQRQTFVNSTATTDDKGDYSRLNLMARYSF
ncbi:DcaP family trimeric outer membrane transporter [Acinetobacter sp.]|uniref:DcaP family trimeric outer membrane transporter n=1 Tax=Acinetobacter sp. TaxID=472 RepID=UPI0031D2812D